MLRRGYRRKNLKLPSQITRVANLTETMPVANSKVYTKHLFFAQSIEILGQTSRSLIADSDSTVQLIYRIGNIINETLEESYYWAPVFLDASQAFDRD